MITNSCNINKYRDGNDCAGWHCDDEPLFETDDGQISIVSLSLGASRVFQYREIKSHNYKLSQTKSIKLNNGDICTMEGLFQNNYQHRVPIDTNCYKPRFNLTWRWITTHNCNCPNNTININSQFGFNIDHNNTINYGNYNNGFNNYSTFSNTNIDYIFQHNQYL